MNTNDFDILMYDQAFYNLIYTKYIFIKKKKPFNHSAGLFSTQRKNKLLRSIFTFLIK